MIAHRALDLDLDLDLGLGLGAGTKDRGRKGGCSESVDDCDPGRDPSPRSDCWSGHRHDCKSD